MLKRIPSLLLAAALSMSLMVAVVAAESMDGVQAAVAAASAPVQTQPQAQAVQASFYFNNFPVYDAPLYEHNGVVYAPLRAFFEVALPGCSLQWLDGQAVVSGSVDGQVLNLTARPGDCYVTANGRTLYVPGTVLHQNYTTMLPLDVMAKIFNGCVWRNQNGAYIVSLGEGVLPSASEFYNADALDLLSRLVYAEAGNQPLLGKIAVANVVLNRVADPSFPDTIYDVIYQRNQFSVVSNGTIYNTPNDSSVLAAKLALEGAGVTDALFFHRAGLKCWASQNRPYVTTIGDHAFYG